ncbi:MAG: hypothetical protein O3B70_01725 [Bacteroidetes bacterium]|nr:hypothetical protein [Bacteroidota bacterium]MDA0903028.1 hypothetical protein [Bacteroidota bacterium]MDA1241762.1 hypothetical protein [Bacteroidota bacterium]
MTSPQEVRWRLRHGTRIVGYERTLGRHTWFSRDGFWWNGGPLAFTEKDRWTGWKDRHNRWLYEWDVVDIQDKPGPWFLGWNGDDWELRRPHIRLIARPYRSSMIRVGYNFPLK